MLSISKDEILFVGRDELIASVYSCPTALPDLVESETGEGITVGIVAIILIYGL